MFTLFWKISRFELKTGSKLHTAPANRKQTAIYTPPALASTSFSLEGEPYNRIFWRFIRNNQKVEEKKKISIAFFSMRKRLLQIEYYEIITNV